LAGGLNLYGYADGDPINKSDPFGLSACCVVLSNFSSTGVAEGVQSAAAQGFRELGTEIANTAEILGAALGAKALLTGGGSAIATRHGVARQGAGAAASAARAQVRSGASVMRGGTLGVSDAAEG
jgi:uncharacterized protein RhaS with RHS repeats